MWPVSHLKLSDSLAQDGGRVKPIGRTGFLVQLSDTYRYLMGDILVVGDSWPGGY